MASAPCRTQTCGESKSALGVGAQKYVVDLIQELLIALSTFENLNQATVAELCQIKEIRAAKAIQIKAPLEVEKLIVSKPKGVTIKLKSSQVFVEKKFLL
jgi:DNA repair protein RadC